MTRFSIGRKTEINDIEVKVITTILLTCVSSMALLSCGKIQPAEIPQPRQEEEKQEDNSQSTAMIMTITAGGRTITATLSDNPASKELAEKLKAGPVTVRMKANGFEHYGPLGFSLTRQDEQITAASGDILLYNGNNICVFYGSNSLSYTRLGKVEGLSADELKSFFGKGDISVTYSLKQ